MNGIWNSLKTNPHILFWLSIGKGLIYITTAKTFVIMGVALYVYASEISPSVNHTVLVFMILVVVGYWYIFCFIRGIRIIFRGLEDFNK